MLVTNKGSENPLPDPSSSDGASTSHSAPSPSAHGGSRATCILEKQAEIATVLYQE